MKSIFITGSGGFVGQNIIKHYNYTYDFYRFSKNNEININQDVVLHLAGKAHDLKNISNSSEYYQVNTELTKRVFDAFLVSNSKVFITLSSVKAVADEVDVTFLPHVVKNGGTNLSSLNIHAMLGYFAVQENFE